MTRTTKVEKRLICQSCIDNVDFQSVFDVVDMPNLVDSETDSSTLIAVIDSIDAYVVIVFRRVSSDSCDFCDEEEDEQGDVVQEALNEAVARGDVVEFVDSDGQVKYVHKDHYKA